MSRRQTIGQGSSILGMLALGAVLSTVAVTAQDAGGGARIRPVSTTPVGGPPTGPHAVVVEHDQALATHTIYRPATLGSSPHPLLVWGEGGCAKNGLMFPEFLTEIASHGFVVIADGPPVEGAGRGGPGGAGRAGAAAGAPANAPGPRAGGAPGPGARSGGGADAPGPRAGGAPAGAQAGGRAGGAPGGRGRGGAPMTDGSALIAAMDWMDREVSDKSSRFYQKVDTKRVAAMGMSCGGLMSYGASADPRIATVGIWNSGLTQPDEKIIAGLHSSVIIVTGGESDIAYANGKRDFETMPARIPIFYGVYPSIGHGGTYNQDNGGPFGVAAVNWLKWQLQNDTEARTYFVGDTCRLCADPQWQTASRSLK